jgi:DNA (cytosine-5)-methyltransferase 1
MRGDSSAAYCEVFAGGGMARRGLGPLWSRPFANDVDPAKARAYGALFGARDLTVGDVWGLGAGDLPGRALRAWACFQDLSRAGAA